MKRSVTHATFTIERRLKSPPSKVFKAFSDPKAKRAWFGGPPEWEAVHEMDFRVGGREISRGGPNGGTVHAMEARYWDIVPDERIVHTYDLLLDGVRISVSLQTIEFRADGTGTTLVFTEVGAYFDGYDDAGQREKGTRFMVDLLVKAVDG